MLLSQIKKGIRTIVGIFQERLNSVDYSFKNYTPSKNALIFANFIKEVEKDNLENTTPLSHMKWFDNIFSGYKRLIGCCHRGFAKTTSIEYLFLYLACFNSLGDFGKVRFAMYIGDTIENGVKNLRKNIEVKYQKSEFLQKMIPNNAIRATASDRESSINLINADGFESGRKFTDVRIEFRNINGEPFVIRGYGASTGIRGARELGERPTLACIDDILNDEDSRSDTIIQHLNDVVYKAVAKALHPTRQKIIWLGTPFNSKDPLYTAIESGTWTTCMFPICEKFPVSKEEFRGSWEDRFTYEYVKDSYDEAIQTGRPDHFYQELMLQIIPDVDRIVPEHKIQWINNKDLQKRNPNYNYYITTDFAVSSSDTGDFSVISVWAITNNRDYILVDGIAARQPLDTTIKQLLMFASKYQPLQVGIEVTGQQLGFVSFLTQEQIRTNVFFNINEVRPTKDKLSRFMEFSPIFNRMKVYFNEALPYDYINELKDELSKATLKGLKSKHDDILDTISMLHYLDIFTPTQESISVNQLDNVQRDVSAFEKFFYDDSDVLSLDYDTSGRSPYIFE